MRKHRRILSALLLSLSIVQYAPEASAADSMAKVQVPSFPVQVNGTTIDNRHAAYPLLIYKDITYFPMTWDYCKGLGLSVQWNAETGLTIQNEGTTLNEMKQDLSGNNDTNSSYSAVMPTYPIQVNGQAIDNAHEPYPVLNFRDITYFPMTWRFAREEFHMVTDWSMSAGFSIVTQQQRMLSQILYDDADFLYLSSSGMLKINKSLTGNPVKLTNAEEQDVYKKASERQRKLFPPVEAAVGQNPITERSGDDIMSKGTTLLSLKDRPGLAYTETVTPLNEGAKLLTLRLSPLNLTPAPYIPEAHSFILRGDQAAPIAGSNQQPASVLHNADGSACIISFAPNEQIMASNASLRGEVIRVDAQGNAKLINEQLNVHDIEAVASDRDGSLLIRAYSRLPMDQGNAAFGLYRIGKDGALSKVSALSGIAYSGENGDIYVLDGEMNKITSLTNQRSQTWYDYELAPILMP